MTWFCYQLISKPGNKTVTVPWSDPYYNLSILSHLPFVERPLKAVCDKIIDVCYISPASVGLYINLAVIRRRHLKWRRHLAKFRRYFKFNIISQQIKLSKNSRSQLLIRLRWFYAHPIFSKATAMEWTLNKIRGVNIMEVLQRPCFIHHLRFVVIFAIDQYVSG